jgi:hypothetical protein
MREGAFPTHSGQSKLRLIMWRGDTAQGGSCTPSRDASTSGFTGTLSSSAERSIHLLPKEQRNFRNLSGLSPHNKRAHRAD